MIGNQASVKILADTSLYAKADYSKEIFNYLMSADIIDKNSEAFANVMYDFKMRQTSPVLIKVLSSNKVVLAIGKKAMPRPFKVFREADVKRGASERTPKIFIDCTDIMKLDNGVYKCTNIQVLISYVISAMVYVMYYAIPDKILMNTTITESGANAFIDMMLYLLGYLKVPVTYSDNKEKMAYALAMYYQRAILNKEDSSTIQQMCKKLSKLDNRKADYMSTVWTVFFDEHPGCSLEAFIVEFARVFMNQEPGEKAVNALSVDAVISRWIYSFGPGTVFGLEFFPAFSSIMTDCYVGAYINQQNTIEKVAGNSVATFTNAMLSLGSENA